MLLKLQRLFSEEKIGTYIMNDEFVMVWKWPFLCRTLSLPRGSKESYENPSQDSLQPDTECPQQSYRQIERIL
jgi:hypothetical protein